MCKNEENVETMDIFNRPLKVIQNSNNKLIDFYLYEDIETVGQYIDFLREVKMANPGDIIQVHINCAGGNVDVAWNIFDELKSSKALTTIFIEGECASAASMIMLAGDDWEINEHSYVMVHAWHSALYGKKNELEALSDFQKKYYATKFKEIYKNFLTPEEIEKCLEGKDYYFTSEETVKRIESFQKEDEDNQKGIQKIVDKYQIALNKEVENFLKEKEKGRVSDTKRKVNPKKEKKHDD